MASNKTSFAGSIAGLFAASRLGWNQCSDNLAVFKEVSNIYTPTYVANALKAIDDAEKIPGQGNRAGRRSSMRVSLKTAQEKGLANWQQLKGYIEKAWTNDVAMLKAKLAEAGLGLYRMAMGGKWREVSKLLRQGADFIADNKDALLAGDNMPADFEKKYENDMNVFNAQWNNYGSIGSTNEVDTSVRTKANNGVYNSLKVMLSDGKRIFAKDAAEKKQFSYINLLRQSGYGGSAGMRVELTTGKAKLPVANVEAVSSDDKYEGVTDSKGLLVIRKMKEGEHTFTFAADNFQPLTVTIELKAGVVSKFSYSLVKEAMESMKVVPQEKVLAA